MSMLTVQKHRAGGVSQHVFRRAAENHFDDTPMAVSADEKQVVLELVQVSENSLLRISAIELIASFDGISAEVSFRTLEHGLADLFVLCDREDGQRQPQYSAELGRRFHRRAGPLTAVIGQQ